MLPRYATSKIIGEIIVVTGPEFGLRSRSGGSNFLLSESDAERDSITEAEGR